MTDKAACNEPEMSSRQFRRRHAAMAMPGQDAFAGQGHLRDEERAALTRALARLKTERDVRKKAAA